MGKLFRRGLLILVSAFCLLPSAFNGQTILTAPGLATFGTNTVSGGGGGGGGGPWSLVAHVGMSAISSGGTSSAINTTGASAIILCMGSFSAAPTPTDSKGNTYTLVKQQTTASYYVSIWICASPTVGSGHTFTTGNNYANLSVLAFSGGAGGVTDQSNSGGGSGITTVQPGSVTPGTDNQLVITAYNSASTASVSIDSGFTITDQQNSSAGAERNAGAYLIQTSAGAVNPTWSQISGSSDDMMAVIATFK